MYLYKQTLYCTLTAKNRLNCTLKYNLYHKFVIFNIILILKVHRHLTSYHIYVIISGGLRPKSRPRGEIVLENIHFTYLGAPLLSGLNLHLLPGKSVALVGRSGCGKSTIASLILRLYDPERGRVLLDGVDIKQLDPVWLRSHIGFVSQVHLLLYFFEILFLFRTYFTSHQFLLLATVAFGMIYGLFFFSGTCAIHGLH